MGRPYYSVRKSYNPKLKSVDKFTHFIIYIGNYVNKIAWILKYFKKNLLAPIDNTFERFTDNSERQACGSSNPCICECPNERIRDIH